MLGNITQSTGNNSAIKKQELNSINSRIDGLEKKVEDQKERIDELGTEIVTQSLTTDDIVSQRVNTTSIEADSSVLKSSSITNLEAVRINANSIQATEATIPTINSTNLKGQLVNNQSNLKATSITSSNVSTTKATVGELTATKLHTDSVDLKTVVTQTFGSNSVTSSYGNIQDLQSTKVKAGELEATSKIKSPVIITDNLEIDELESNKVTTTELEADKLTSDSEVSPVHTGKLLVNLDPQLATDESYYLLKIKKGFDTFSFGVEDSFDCKIIQAYCGYSEVTNASTLVLLHQVDLDEVFLLSSDKDYVYVQISPDNTNELYYRYTARDEIEDIIQYSVNEEIDYDYYYNPMKTSEVIMLGNSNGHSSDSYQFTILGKLWSTLSPDFADMMFDSIHISHDIHVKDYYNELDGSWVYKKGIDNQYLNTVNEEWDDTLKQWVTRIEWKSPVDNTSIQSINLTDDTTEEVKVLDESGVEQVIGERNSYGTKKRLLTTETVANWNGKVVDDTKVILSNVNWSDTPIPVKPAAPILLEWPVWIVADGNEPRKIADEGHYFRWSVGSGLYYEVDRFDDRGYYSHYAGLVVMVYNYDPNGPVPYTDYNPIIKLGTVDEGSIEYGAGFVHTEELGIKKDITWKTSEEKDSKDYSVWLDGDIPTTDDFNWVRR